MFACNLSKFRNFIGKKVFVVAQGRYWDPILKRFYLKGTSSVFEGTIEKVDLTKSGNRRFFSKHISGISITVKAVTEDGIAFVVEDLKPNVSCFPEKAEAERALQRAEKMSAAGYYDWVKDEINRLNSI